MTFALLLACSAGPEPKDVSFDRVDTLVDAVEIWPEDERETQWGWSIAVGSDLDHDGNLEWAASAPVLEFLNPYGDADAAVVRIFEGEEAIGERRPRHERPLDFGAMLDAGADLDGDGFGDLLFTSLSTNESDPVEVVIAHGTNARRDTALRRWDASASALLSSAILIDAAAAGPAVLVHWASDYSLLFSDELELYEDNVVPRKASLEIAPQDWALHGESLVTDGDGDGISEWVYARYCRPGHDCDPPVGLFRCAVDPSVQVPGDCEPMGDPSHTEVGEENTTGDLDGDGRDELISSANTSNGDDGLVIVYRSDGTPLARIEGTRGAMFGLNPTYVTDGHGDPWLLIGQVNYSGNDPGTVWAFRGEQLVGSLTDEDATKVFQKGRGPLGQAMAVYQETPDSPRWLLLSSGSAPIYMVPFDDP